MIIISCHADTCFSNHSLTRLDDGRICGILDNFAGVHAVMNAYFSGRLNSNNVRLELTYGEEEDFAGAQEVLKTVGPDDFVIVVDVTGTETDADVVIEKCRNPLQREFLAMVLEDMAVEIYDGCPDPVASEDESDVFSLVSPYTFMLGVPVFGGDYNEEAVFTYQRNIDAVAETICRIVEQYDLFLSLRAQMEEEACHDYEDAENESEFSGI